MLDEFVRCHGTRTSRYDVRDQPLTEFLIGNPHHDRLHNTLVVHQAVLDLGGIHVLSLPDTIMSSSRPSTNNRPALSR